MKYQISNKSIQDYRPEKEAMDPYRPYLWLHEEEVQSDGCLSSVNTIFLTNRECPFKCTMCDLWRHTLDEPTPGGAIPEQIRFAQKKLPDADVVKLYNSGNFFDGKAIPRDDYREIADLLSDYDHIIVENHPKLIGDFIPEFRDMLNGSFEIAMGLESIHPVVMPGLNKQITRENYRRASEYLVENGMDVRAFVLLNPPFLTDERENIEWCLKTVEFAFDCGASAVSVIPTRDGNGIMEELRVRGEYVPPRLSALEEVFDRALQMKKGRVFADLWDLEKFSDCSECFEERKKRLEAMNLGQKKFPLVECRC
ncbi:radical SAM protein [Rhodohalobacter mucosus]|uniref:Radical SAM protein n=1 Tax=Rhodohalobacter mucosus TaxID=2079485 RepID=A0A316TUD5_9BACT|nr:radical SAM protein [Rhodohalobacter mucosus]PWN07271.1 radical SAM protein [Rhodohalobacter mucosus]